MQATKEDEAMTRTIAILLVALGAAACSEATPKPAEDPSVTSTTSAQQQTGHHEDLSEEHEDHGDALRN